MTLEKTKRNRYVVFSLILMGLTNRIPYIIGHLLSENRFHYDLSIPADHRIPLVPWTLLIYFGCIAYWAALYWKIALGPRKESDRFFLANLLGKAVCFVFYVAFPTTLERPEAVGTTFWDGIMRLLYSIDAPTNLFPSLHCLLAWLCWIALRGKKEYSAFWRISAFVMAFAVFASTLTTRQHVIVDIPAGVVCAELCYWLAGNEKLRSRYTAAVDRFLGRFSKTTE